MRHAEARRPGYRGAPYKFDGFMRKSLGVLGSGDIRLSGGALKDMFLGGEIQLPTDDGRRLDLRFSAKRLLSASDAVLAFVAGDLPVRTRSWRH
jgi:hypothetical protein